MTSKEKENSLHKVFTGLLTASVLGGFHFVMETRSELALLRQDIALIKQSAIQTQRDLEDSKKMGNKILEIIERVHPRR
jgi:hypothetical protein